MTPRSTSEGTRVSDQSGVTPQQHPRPYWGVSGAERVRRLERPFWATSNEDRPQWAPPVLLATGVASVSVSYQNYAVHHAGWFLLWSLVILAIGFFLSMWFGKLPIVVGFFIFVVYWAIIAFVPGVFSVQVIYQNSVYHAQVDYSNEISLAWGEYSASWNLNWEVYKDKLDHGKTIWEAGTPFWSEWWATWNKYCYKCSQALGTYWQKAVDAWNCKKATIDTRDRLLWLHGVSAGPPETWDWWAVIILVLFGIIGCLMVRWRTQPQALVVLLLAFAAITASLAGTYPSPMDFVTFWN